MTSHYQKALHKISETSRYAGTEINRQGVVDEVKEEGGERKFRCTIGYTPDGTPWRTPWMSSQEHRSGGQRGQSKVTVGQNMTIQGPTLRQASATPQAEAKHAPQPKHAPEVNGESMSVGGKLRTALHGGKEEEGSQGGQSGGASGGGGGGGQQQQGEEHHYEASWIAEDKEELPKYQPGDGKVETSKGSQLGGSSDFGRADQQQQKPQQQQEEKRAMQRVMHEKEGHTAVIGKGDDAVRMAAHPKGSKIRAGKENYFVAEKDKDSFMYAQKNVYVRALEKHYVADAWIIKKGPKDPVPNHDLSGKSGGSGTA